MTLNGVIALILRYFTESDRRPITSYTVSQKNDTDVAGYIFNAHQPILIVFGR